jgi:uncharacterized protein YjiS (DUF1127 family)
MSTHTGTTPYHLPATHLAGPLAAVLHRALTRLRMSNARRALAAELSGLSDRELADIGLSPAATPVGPEPGLLHIVNR